MPKRSNTSREIGKLKEEVAGLAQQLGTVVDSAKDDTLGEVRAQMQRVKRSLDDVLAEAGDKGQEAATAVKDVADTFAETIEETMHERPLMTLALAAGVGFVLGAAMRR